MTGKVRRSIARFGSTVDDLFLVDGYVDQLGQFPFDLDEFVLTHYQHIAYVAELARLIDILIEGQLVQELAGLILFSSALF